MAREIYAALVKSAAGFLGIFLQLFLAEGLKNYLTAILPELQIAALAVEGLPHSVKVFFCVLRREKAHPGVTVQMLQKEPKALLRPFVVIDCG